MNIMKEINVDATIANVPKVTEFIDGELEMFDCPMKVQMAIDVAVDEIFSNIANYAYKDKIGKATVQVDFINDNKIVVITFIDEGTQYDPLKNADPDVTAKIDDRRVGGLGIFIVKKSMDDVHYEYKDNKNILTIKKKI